MRPNFILLSLGLVAWQSHASPVYMLRPISEAYSYGIAINDLGDAVITSNGVGSSLVFADGSKVALDFSGRAINSQGDVAGYVYGDNLFTLKMQSQSGPIDVQTPINRWIVVNAINEKGVFAGTQHPLLFLDHAYYYDNGYVQLNDDGYRGSFAYDINDSKMTVGSVYDNMNEYPAFWNVDGQLTVIQDQAISRGYATNVNNSGAVVGVFDRFDGTESAFLYQDGIFTDLNFPLAWAGSFTQALINDKGEMVITAMNTATGQIQPFYSFGGETVALPTFSYDQGYSVATGINNNGQIIGYSLDWNIYNPRAVIWDPDSYQAVPEPSSFAALAVGLGALAFIRRRSHQT